MIGSERAVEYVTLISINVFKFYTGVKYSYIGLCVEYRCNRFTQCYYQMSTTGSSGKINWQEFAHQKSKGFD